MKESLWLFYKWLFLWLFYKSGGQCLDSPHKETYIPTFFSEMWDWLLCYVERIFHLTISITQNEFFCTKHVYIYLYAIQDEKSLYQNLENLSIIYIYRIYLPVASCDIHFTSCICSNKLIKAYNELNKKLCNFINFV